MGPVLTGRSMRRPRPRRSEVRPETTDTLLELIIRFSRRDCTKLNDRVYALLGLAIDSQHLKVDYEKELQVLALDLILDHRSNMNTFISEKTERRQLFYLYSDIFRQRAWEMLYTLNCTFQRSCLECYRREQPASGKDLIPLQSSRHEPSTETLHALQQ